MEILSVYTEYGHGKLAGATSELDDLRARHDARLSSQPGNRVKCRVRASALPVIM